MSQANELEPEEKEIVSDVTEQEEKDHAEKEEPVEGADEEVLEDEDEGETEALATDIPTRGENRHQKLANELKKEREEKEALIRREATAIAEINLMRQQRYQTDTGENARKEQEALALMEPHERAAYSTSKEINALKNQMYHMQISSQDAQDKAVFQARASIDPDIAKHADAVERIHAEMKAKGVSSTRDDILKWQLGDELMKNKLENKNKKTAAGERRIRQVSSNPSSARSDAGSSRGGALSFEEKFERDFANRGI